MPFSCFVTVCDLMVALFKIRIQIYFRLLQFCSRSVCVQLQLRPKKISKPAPPGLWSKSHCSDLHSSFQCSLLLACYRRWQFYHELCPKWHALHYALCNFFC